MKKIYSADWHITFKKPRIRTDDYTYVQYDKIKFICELANKHNARLIVAGDIFDKPYCPIPWLYAYMVLFQSVKNGVYVVYGQHDLHFHNPNLGRTPIGILLAAGAVKHAGQIMDVCNFGEVLPEQHHTHLCIHAPITQYEPPFFMEDAVSAADFLQENPEWQYVVSGDFHEQHVTEVEGRILFNPGPIMRADKGKMQMQPKVILHDDTNNEWEWIEIPIKQNIFDIDKLDADDRKDYKDRIREFANNIDVGVKQNFRENVQLVISCMKPKDKTLEILDSIMETTNER